MPLPQLINIYIYMAVTWAGQLTLGFLDGRMTAVSAAWCTSPNLLIRFTKSAPCNSPMTLSRMADMKSFVFFSLLATVSMFNTPVSIGGRRPSMSTIFTTWVSLGCTSPQHELTWYSFGKCGTIQKPTLWSVLLVRCTRQLVSQR